MATLSKPEGVLPYNRVRFDAYRRCANEFVIGETYDANELANMLHDLRWAEVPRAFSAALYNAALNGPLRPGLARNFKELLEYVTFLAFGSAEREVVQPWYLKNWDDFFVSCVEGILSLNNRADNVLLKRETVMTLAHAFLMDEVAQSILDAQSFDVLSWDHAFGHFAGSQKWRSFAERCKLYASQLGAHTIPAVRLLDNEVEHAYMHARNAIHKIHKSVADEDGWSNNTNKGAKPNKRKPTDASSARNVASKRRAPSNAPTPNMPTAPLDESICYQVALAIPTSSHTLYSDLGNRKIVC